MSIKSNKDIKVAEVYDASGKLLKQTDSKTIDMSKLPAGSYILKITFADGSLLDKKIIKN
ncbi:MAG: hypothetical protein DI529_08060 [Chryseobacterium sp.]|nr:MAG: hypothetical protein DI529_08060 [Chryseobacterium sp.]